LYPTDIGHCQGTNEKPPELSPRGLSFLSCRTLPAKPED
jgi:hypothetical protein